MLGLILSAQIHGYYPNGQIGIHRMDKIKAIDFDVDKSYIG